MQSTIDQFITFLSCNVWKFGIFIYRLVLCIKIHFDVFSPILLAVPCPVTETIRRQQFSANFSYSLIRNTFSLVIILKPLR